MATVTIEEAQAKLPDLIHRMFPGEQLVITEKANPGSEDGNIAQYIACRFAFLDVIGEIGESYSFRWCAIAASVATLGSHPASNPVTGPFSVPNNDVGAVHWNQIAWGGGLFNFVDHIRLDHYGIKSQDARFPQTSTCALGSSSCGDVIVYNAEGLAGFLSHETGTVHLASTVPEMFDWIFGELAEGRMPELDSERR